MSTVSTRAALDAKKRARKDGFEGGTGEVQGVHGEGTVLGGTGRHGGGTGGEWNAYERGCCELPRVLF